MCSRVFQVIFLVVTIVFVSECVKVNDLRAVTIFKSNIAIGWNKTENASMYQVYVLPQMMTMNTTENSALLSGLQPNTNYTISVKVIQVNGMAHETNETVTMMVQTNIASYMDISNMTAKNITKHSVTLTWDHITNATSYFIVYTKVTDTSIRQDVLVSDNKVMLKDLQPNTEYKAFVLVTKLDPVQMRAAQSKIIMFKTMDTKPMIVNLTLGVNTTAPGKVLVTWSSYMNATLYTLTLTTDENAPKSFDTSNTQALLTIDASVKKYTLMVSVVEVNGMKVKDQKINTKVKTVAVKDNKPKDKGSGAGILACSSTVVLTTISALVVLLISS